MATTVPVLQIPIDDSQWREFLATFEKFKIDAADVPGAMAAIDRAVERLPEHLRPVTEGLEDAAEGAADALEDAGIAGGGGKGSGGGGGGKKRRGGGRKVVPAIALDWTLSALGARRFGYAITGATRDLARWERLTVVFSGLLGAGGLYGINALAAKGAERRRESSGLGVSSGELASFQTNYARLGDTSGILAGLSHAETDINARQPLQSLGVNPKGKSSLQIFGEMLPKLKDIADRADPNTFSASIKPYNLDALGIDERTMRLIRALPREEIDTMRRNAADNVGQLGIPDDVGRKWQDLITTFHKAETQIQTALADDLVQLTPGLMHLSDTATHLVDQLLSRQELKDWLARANKGLLWFADEIGSEDARTKLKDFLHHFDMAKSDFDALNNWLANHTGMLTTAFSIGAAWMVGGPLAAGAAAVLVGGHYAGQAIDPYVPRLPAPQSGGRTQGDELGLPGVDAPAPDKESQKAPTSQQTPAAPGTPHAENDSFLNDRSRRELAGVNAPLAENLLEASKRSGIQFQVLQGRRTQAEADQNAASGIGVKNSQHLYGAAADIVMIDPKTGQKTYDRALYAKFAQSFNDVNKERGTHQRWLGDSSGRWGRDIPHFDQGIGYGQSHAPQPYGHGAEVTKEDIKEGREEVYKSPENPFRKHEAAAAAAPAAPAQTDENGDAINRHEDFAQRKARFAREDAEKAAASKVPADMRGRADHRHAVRSLLAPHPYTRPKPPQSVVVSDNSGGSSMVTVAH